MQSLFGIPGDFLNELVVQEPRVLTYSASMLTAKFESLVQRNRAFQDDVADMILVEPSLLVNAVPTPRQPSPSSPERVQHSRERSSTALFGVINSNVESRASSPDRQDTQYPLGGSSSTRNSGAPMSTTNSPAITSSREGSSGTSSRRDGSPSALSAPLASSGSKNTWSSSSGRSISATTRQAGRLSVLDSLLHLSSSSGVSLTAILQLCVVDETVLAGGGDGLSSRLLSLGSAMSMDSAQVKAAITTHPGLLAIPQAELDRRKGALLSLLEPEVAKTKKSTKPAPSPPAKWKGSVSGADFLSRFTETRPAAAAVAAVPVAAETADAGGSSSGGSSSGASSMVSRHPELLLSAPEQVELQLNQLAALFDLSMPRILVLVAAAPSLALRPLAESSEKLLALQSLFEVPRALVVELLCKEPALLQLEVSELEMRFKALAATFGSFTDDALMMVLADPSMLMRAGAGKALRSYDEEDVDGDEWDGDLGGRGMAGGKVAGEVLPSRRKKF